MALTLSQVEAKLLSLEVLVRDVLTKLDGCVGITQYNNSMTIIQTRLQEAEDDIESLQGSVATLQATLAEED
jgi:peptidoglycan hydrolase CwlO-like protein